MRDHARSCLITTPSTTGTLAVTKLAAISPANTSGLGEFFSLFSGFWVLFHWTHQLLEKESSVCNSFSALCFILQNVPGRCWLRSELWRLQELPGENKQQQQRSGCVLSTPVLSAQTNVWCINQVCESQENLITIADAHRAFWWHFVGLFYAVNWRGGRYLVQNFSPLYWVGV